MSSLYFGKIEKILIVISSFGSGGAEQVVSNLATAWCKAGKKVTIFTTFLNEDKNQDFFPIPVNVQRVRLADHCQIRTRGLTDNLRRMLIFRSLSLSLKPDVVISFMDHINILTLISLFGARIPVIVNETGDPFKQPIGKVLGWLRPKVYKWASVITALNSLIAHRMELEWKLKKVHVLPNSLPENVPETLPWERRDKTILSVGRMRWEKGQDVLLKAWAKICYKFPDWKLNIVGDGPEWMKLGDYIQSAGLEKSVDLLGEKYPVWPYYQQARIFMLPSRYEAFGNVLIEAMAMGCPCISTNCSGPQTIVTNEVNGLLVAPENPEEIANALVRLLKDESLCLRLSENGIIVRDLYSYRRNVEDWEKVFQLIN